MTKKTTDKLADAALVKRVIKAYFESVNISINKLSEEVGVSQSDLCRFVNGERISLTKTARKALSYVKKRHNWHNIKTKLPRNIAESDEYKIIENAVLSYWDGSRQSAELLAEIIKALKPALDMASKASRENLKGISYDGEKRKNNL